MHIYSEFQTDTIDLALDFYGYENTTPGYSFGPAIRQNYVIHYIISGKGYFHYKGKITTLTAGDLFLLKPGETTFYQADEKEPWSYYWLGISGKKADDYFNLTSLSKDAYLKSNTKGDSIALYDTIKDIITFCQKKEHVINRSLYLLGQIYHFLYLLSELSPRMNTISTTSSQKLVLTCKNIIEHRHIMNNLSIHDIAQELNVNRCYLTTIFKEYVGISPKEYLFNTRMTHARKLLLTTLEPINIIAYSVGYTDPLYFSKVFKQYHHISPSQFRKNDKLNEISSN